MTTGSMEAGGPAGAVPRLRPLSVGEILDVAIKLFRTHATTLMKIVVVVVVPVEIINLLITTSTTSTYDIGGFIDDTNATYSDEAAYAAGQVVIVFLGVAVSVLATVACFKAVADAYLGKPPAAGASLAFAARRAPATVWLGLLMIVLLMPAFLAVFVPGIWLGVAWSMAFPVMLLDRVGGVKALRRSFRLVRHRWWPTFGTLFVGQMLATLAAGAIEFALIALALVAVPSDSFLGLVMLSTASTVGQLLTTPFMAALIVILFFDLRVRKEGFDLALLAERMAQAPGG